MKTIIFLSNYFNHHQKPFADAMAKEIGRDFLFIETEEMPPERVDMGWQLQEYPAYVVRASDFKSNLEKYSQLIYNAKAVIYGSAPASLVKNRANDQKLVFRYAERQLKKGLEIWKYPYRLLKWHLEYGMGKNVHLLCASAYTAGDYARFFLFKDRAYKWGYFPEVKKYDDINKIIELKHPASILWVARLIEWKHPEVPILIAKKLKEEGYQFQMTLIGTGELEGKVRQMIQECELHDCVKLLRGMTPEQVREHMEKSQIFLFTSDRQEGWGAVLNESMNSGCAVVANASIGSVPYLLQHGINGMIYATEEEAYKCVRELLDSESCHHELGRAAYETVTSLWNPELAAKRLFALIKEIGANGSCDLFSSGPCSREN